MYVLYKHIFSFSVHFVCFSQKLEVIIVALCNSNVCLHFICH